MPKTTTEMSLSSELNELSLEADIEVEKARKATADLLLTLIQRAAMVTPSDLVQLGEAVEHLRRD